MENEAENILISLADLIDWDWKAPSDPSEWGQWVGRSDRATYRITVPTLPDDVDTLPQNRVRGLRVLLRQGGSEFQVPITSVGQAKSLCVRHAISGDLQEMRTAQKALRTEQQTYHEHEKAGRKPLNVAFYTGSIPRLPWDGNDPLAMTLQITGTRGVYDVRFEEPRRWVVRCAGQEEDAEEHCFFNRGIVQMACSLHDHTGQWCGMYKPGVSVRR